MPDDITAPSAVAAPESTPVEKAVAASDVAGFRDAKRANLKSGTSHYSPPSQESAPAQPAEQAASTDATSSAASEPAKPPSKTESRKAELQADIEATLKRRAEVRAELAAEEARLAALRAPASDVTPAASSPAAPKFSFASFEDWSKVAGNTERAYEDYIEERAVARVEFNAQAKADTERRTQAETRHQAESQRIQQAWRSKVDAARLKHADYDAVALQAPCEVQRGSMLDYWILESPDGAEVLYHLQQHPEEIRRLSALAPIAQARELVKLEASLSAPPSKHVSDAPAPPVTLGSHTADASDALDDAVMRGDVASYRAEKLARLRALKR